MRNLPVHWFEGMFLRPQHFQAADRYWTELAQASEQLDHPYSYGISRVEISAEALGNSQIQINICHARFKDGTIVMLGDGQEPDRVDVREAFRGLNDALSPLQADLKSHFESAAMVRVYLAIPKLKMGASNIAADRTLGVAEVDEAGKHRFQEQVRELQDETTGGNDQEVRLKTLNVRILLSTQDLSGYEVLPIAQIQRSGDRDATPKLDARYFPPMLGIDAWSPLGRDIVRAIYDIIGKQIETLSQQVVYRGNTLVTDEPGDLDRIMMLNHLNTAYAQLGVTAFAHRLHPLIAYTELCRLIGTLSLFGPERRAPEVLRYDHDDLARIFYWAKEQIEQLLGSGPRDEYEQRPFIGTGLGMQVTLEDKWLNTDWKWFVGVQHENITDEECADLLSTKVKGQETLDWKLGSKTRVQMLFDHGLPGLQLVPVSYTPRALPRKGDWKYYEVSREGIEWKEVHSTKTLAMRFRHRLIENPEDLPGKRRIVVNHRGKRADLEFALFAVRGGT